MAKKKMMCCFININTEEGFKECIICDKCDRIFMVLEGEPADRQTDDISVFEKAELNYYCPFCGEKLGFKGEKS